MRLVIDANIVISLLIRPADTAPLFFDESFELYAPELLFEEVRRNMTDILRKTRLEKREVAKVIDILKQRITVVNEREFVSQRARAEQVCPDPKDIAYFALAFHLECGIWTNEKKLKNQEVVHVHSTADLFS